MLIQERKTKQLHFEPVPDKDSREKPIDPITTNDVPSVDRVKKLVTRPKIVEKGCICAELFKF